MSDPEARRLTGHFPPELIAVRSIPRLEPAVLDGLRALDDLTSLISDALDTLGIVGAVPASVLRPTIETARIVGPALTLRNEPMSVTPADAARMKNRRRLGDLELHNLAEPGDVLVIQGVSGVSNMGNISAALGHRQREGGAVVDGAVRDVDRTRAIGYPIWSESRSPMTGKYRVHTTEINGPVVIRGITVHPGDIVAADATGVCFIPHLRAREVLAVASTIVTNETRRIERIRAGIPISELGD